MIKIYGQDGKVAGEISEAQLAYLQEQFEEESPDDTDYYVSAETVEMLEESGADPELLTVIRAAVGATGEGDIRWSRD